MKSSPGLEDRVRQLIDSRGVAVLATRGQEYPHACLVAFVATEDLKHLYFITSRATKKFENLQLDGRVMLLIDDRSNTEKDFSRATVITGRGTAFPVENEAARGILPFYLERHPHLEAFAMDKSSVLVRVDIESYAVVTRFQEVLVLALGPEAKP